MADNQMRGIEGQDCPAIRVTENAGCPSIRIRVTGGGETPEAPISDVNFYDYDGKRVASYTAADFAALDAMPANPSHQGLTAQGWNWSLADAKTYVAAYGKVDIGQQYVTDDGKTRLYVQIPNLVNNTLTVNFYQSIANDVTVDWGDGSTAETVAGTNNVSVVHSFVAPGDYCITLKAGVGTLKLGHNAGNTSLIGTSANGDRALSARLLRVELGSGLAEIGNYTFGRCVALRSVSIPKEVISLGTSAFSEALSLRGLSIPHGVTDIPNYFVSSCSSLFIVALPKTLVTIKDSSFGSNSARLSLVIPDSVTSIGLSPFFANYAMTSVTIPPSVTSIGNSAFANCYCLQEIHLKGTTPPTIGSAIFNNLPAGFKIYVPASAVATYQGATNWSTYASQIVGE